MLEICIIHTSDDDTILFTRNLNEFMHAAYSLFRIEVDVTDAAKILLFCRNAGENGKLNCCAGITHSIRMKSWWKEFIVHNNAIPNCLNENAIRLMESCWANICRIKATCSVCSFQSSEKCERILLTAH